MKQKLDRSLDLLMCDDEVLTMTNFATARKLAITCDRGTTSNFQLRPLVQNKAVSDTFTMFSNSNHSSGSKYSQVRSYSDSDSDSSDDNIEEDDFIQREIRQQQVRAYFSVIIVWNVLVCDLLWCK